MSNINHKSLDAILSGRCNSTCRYKPPGKCDAPGQAFRWAVFLAIAVLLAACGGKQAATPAYPTNTSPSATLTHPPIATATQESLATLVPSVTPSPAGLITTATLQWTPTPRLSSTLHPTSTLSPTPTKTPRPQVVWASTLGTPISPGFKNGEWSPTANEFVGILDTSTTTGTIALAAAPDFKPKWIDLNHANVKDSVFTWSPDGLWILFRGPRKGYEQLDTSEFGEIWIMGRDGGNPHSIFPGATYRWLGFRGWMDKHTVIFSQYIGGGSSLISILDINTSNEISRAGVFEDDATLSFNPTKDFVPIVSDYPYPSNLFVLSRQHPPVSSKYFSDGWPFPVDRIVLPADAHSPQHRTPFYFQDWVPGTNIMLVSWYAFSDAPNFSFTPKSSRLLLWDVDSNKVSSIAAAGVDGSFSPDGLIFAYTTLGPADSYTSTLAGMPSLDPVLSNNQPYLQLVNRSNNETILSLPVISNFNTLYFNFPKYETGLSFSPDARLLAFLTPGDVQVDTSGWPVSVITTTNQVMINLLDIQGKRLLWSAPASRWSDLSWSPTSAYLAYQNPTKDWQLLDIHRQITLPITLSGGSNIYRTEWSFDGSYLSLVDCHPRPDTSCNYQTVILDITQNITPGTH